MQGGSAHSEGGIGTGNEQHRVWGGISNMNRWYEQQRVGKQREVAQLSARGNAGLEQDRVGGRGSSQVTSNKDSSFGGECTDLSEAEPQRAGEQGGRGLAISEGNNSTIITGGMSNRE